MNSFGSFVGLSTIDTINIKQSKKEFDDYVKRFDTFDIDDKKFESIKHGVVWLNGKFMKMVRFIH
jgi:hypothetical protein